MRRLEALNVEYTEEREARQLLEQYIASREKRDEREGAASHFVHQLLRKRASRRRPPRSCRRSRGTPPRSRRHGAGAPHLGLDERILRRAIAKTGGGYADDDTREAAESEAIEEASRSEPLTSVREGSSAACARGPWARTQARLEGGEALLRWLEENLRPRANGRTRVILFTEYPRRRSGCTRSSPATTSAA